MKSLDIVNKLLEKINQYDDWFLTEVEADQIKQDLEILEIIKKSHLGDDDIFIKFLIASYMDIDEYNKVKQWLEVNENDR